MDDDRATDDASVVADTAGESDTTAEANDREGYTDQEDRFALYEWLGMLTAGLGFFVPLVPLPVAGYCAYRIRNWKPVTAMLISALVVTTVVFWVVVVLFVIP